MSHARGRSFVEVICEKYSPENFPYRRGMGIGIHISVMPQGSPLKERLNLPTILVLDGCGINTAGKESEIAAFCSHVSELDLSDNYLQDWYEISKIVSNLARLTFLNVTSNPLNQAILDSKCAASFSRIKRLVLNNTKVSWETIHTLLQEIPGLEELFLCFNDYRTVSLLPCSYPSLRLLHITDNNLSDWAEIHKLGQMFPGLDTLILANNHLVSITDSQGTLAQLFQNLRSVNLHNSGLSSWDDIDKLKAFPKLEEVRLLGISLLQSYSEEERRKLVIARLPSVMLLNGSKVTGERIDAERFFIRYYMNRPDEELPDRYHELVTQYGVLEPLAVVDLRPQSRAKVEVHFEGKVEVMNIRLDQTVADLKKQLRTVVQLSTNNMRLYYIDQDMVKAFGPEEMKFSTRALHSFSIRDGDEIHVEPKTK
ncbi:tubulin-specific chaperone cofactor E-like protein isoform X2 [Heptranchias perlo]|uniref:tubulin-specific chaperone cofactor E-like protein isoform X2 n=1 Tax=Heptranchias perlo TaxID=212740 RepID=UPI0035597BE1